MSELLTYNVLRALHILADIAWLVGLLYLPRLFVYHAAATAGSELDQTFQIMERKLYSIIMTPAMIAAWSMGLALIWFDGSRRLGWGFLHTPWLLTKLGGVILMTGWHMFLGSSVRAFKGGRNRRSARFWRATNEAPFVLAIIIVFAATTKFGR